MKVYLKSGNMIRVSDDQANDIITALFNQGISLQEKYFRLKSNGKITSIIKVSEIEAVK